MDVKKEDVLKYYGASVEIEDKYSECVVSFEYWSGITGDFYIMTDIKRNEFKDGRVWGTADFTHFDPSSHLSDDPQDFEELIKEQIECGSKFYISDDFEDVLNEVIEYLGDELFEDEYFLEDFPEYKTDED